MSFWLILVFILIFIEIITPLELVTVWFIPAVLVSYILDLLNVDFPIIISVFIVLSIIGFCFMFLYFKKKQTNKDLVNDKFKGKFKVESIAENGMARIRIKDILYFAIEENDVTLSKDDVVETLRLEGNKIIVKKV